MAQVVKNANKAPRAWAAPGGGLSVLQQLIHVSRVSQSLPQSSTDILFRVFGGRVLVHLLLGQVTTIIQNSDPVAKLSSKALSAAGVAIGTAVDFAPTVALTSLEVGGLIYIEGDNTAMILTNAGGGGPANNNLRFVLPQGEVYMTTGASKTGAIKWDMWYQPLDEGAYVQANKVQTVI